ncbi:carbohydrate ABC transporter permease [Jatrophihabitans sp.]|uniref:carbohydrate ABC transporter permease n=1 Tax=Jatrophihabitans sp. TaxID=1932789 RepID=UPI0038CD32CC
MTALDTPPATAAAVDTPAPGGARNAAAWARRAPLMPALIFMFIITQLPFVATLVISFIQWNALRPDLGKSFTGFSNYATVLSDPDFRTSILFTVILTVTVVLVSLFLGLLLALLLDRPFRGRGAVRTMLIAPFLVVPIAAALLWKHALLNPVYGIFNGMLTVIWKIFGSDNPPQPDWVTEHPRLSVEMSLIWQWTPFMMLILLAGLQSRPADAIEAANMDGATSWQQFKYLTLPHLRQYLELGGLLGSIYVVQNFDAVFTITSGGQGTANLPYSIYNIFFTAHDYGQASAAGVLVVIGSIIIATFALRVVSSLFQEEAR